MAKKAIATPGFWKGVGQNLWGRALGFWNVTIAPLVGLRMLLLTGGAVALFWLGNDTIVVKTFAIPLGLVFAVLALLHWHRKTMEPYVDRAVLVAKAQQDPLAAAIAYGVAVARDVAVMVFVLLAAIR
jgi:hypothetical protein